MSKTYIVGTLGQGGSVVNGAGGELFEATDSGEFPNKRAAKRAAAECATMWARDQDGEEVEVGVVMDRGDGSIPDLIATVTSAVGRRNRWS